MCPLFSMELFDNWARIKAPLTDRAISLLRHNDVMLWVLMLVLLLWMLKLMHMLLLMFMLMLPVFNGAV